MQKQKVNVFGHDYYLIGKGRDGLNYYIQKESWDCGWYWGFGYLTAFTNNRCPERSKDIFSHSHISSILDYSKFKEFFKETVLTEDETWEFLDYFMSAYTLKETAELYRHGYSWQTERAKIDELKREDLEKEINTIFLPKLFKNINKLLGEDE